MEIGDDREQGAHMHGDIHHQPLIAGAEKDRNQHQMPAGGDRQEFRQPLHAGQGDDMDQAKGHDAQSAGSVATPGKRLKRRPL